MTEHEQQLISYLEHDQLVADRARPVARLPLSRRATVALWVLRVFVIVVSAMVLYAFVVQLGR
jgi:cytochrome b involved in lipid metabolism